MNVNCGSCRQEYIINEDELKVTTSRFKCQKCGVFVIVTKPETGTISEEGADDRVSETDFVDSILNDEQQRDESQAVRPGVAEQFDRSSSSERVEEEEETDIFERERPVSYNAKKPGKGVTIRTYLSMTFLAGYLFTALVIVVLYWLYVPGLVNEQIEERTAAISKVFSGSVKEYLLVRNYLKINQETERISQIPGVAYTSVINKNGVVVAGVFSQPSKFQAAMLEAVKKTGFPNELAKKNNLEGGEKEKRLEFSFAGQQIYDVAVSLEEAGGEVHVGLFISDIQKSIRKSFFPLLTLIGVLFVMGMISFSLLARFVSTPVQELTEMANRISQGELDERIDTKGPREIRELSRSLDRLRISIRTALRRFQG